MSRRRVMLSNRFGGRSLFGRGFGRGLVVAVSAKRISPGGVVVAVVRLGLPTNFSRGRSRSRVVCRGVQVLQQASVFLGLHSVVFKSSSQLVGVGSAVGIGSGFAASPHALPAGPE